MERMTRREFVEVAGLLGACGCGLSGCATFTKVGHTPAIEPAAYALGPANTLTVSLDKTPTLARAGSAVKITNPALPAWSAHGLLQPPVLQATGSPGH